MKPYMWYLFSQVQLRSITSLVTGLVPLICIWQFQQYVGNCIKSDSSQLCLLPSNGHEFKARAVNISC